MTMYGRVGLWVGVLLLMGVLTAPRVRAHDEWGDWVAYCDEVEGSLRKLNYLLDEAVAYDDGQMWDDVYSQWVEVRSNYEQSGCSS
jgi:hypothetical protein